MRPNSAQMEAVLRMSRMVPWASSPVSSWFSWRAALKTLSRLSSSICCPWQLSWPDATERGAIQEDKYMLKDRI
ncbi:hypothetical protein AALO_G00188160 [Alosa alosa]|uniref:Uncharacterized protein n=1 Tax=Alosa alosa TaxID=278164 RepID=A0AAV6G5F7_9TELE|nr:hypothetical protein AALO_G00188160 [Alosa alosa]